MNTRSHQANDSPDQPSHATPGSLSAAAARLIGERVRAARYTAHLTQDELGGSTFSKSYISAVERGKLTPSVQALMALAARLGVTLSYLLGEAPTASPVEGAVVPEEDREQVARLHEAEQVLKEGRYEEAIALFEEIGQPDRTSWAHEQYAQFLADQGRYRDAYEQMRRAILRSR